MDKLTYLAELAEGLARWVPERERQDILRYYAEYFEEAGPDREADVVRELGDPWALSCRLAVEGGYVTQQQAENWTPPKRKKWPWIVLGTAAVLVFLIGSVITMAMRVGSFVGRNVANFVTGEQSATIEQVEVLFGTGDNTAWYEEEDKTGGFWCMEDGTLDAFDEIDVDASIANVTITGGEDYTLFISSDTTLGGYSVQWEVKDGVLKIRDGGGSRGVEVKSWEDFKNIFGVNASAMDVVITVPSESVSEKVKIKTGLGDVHLSSLETARKVKAETGMGDIECFDIRTCDEVELETGMGDVTLGVDETYNGAKFDLKTGMGNIEASLNDVEAQWDYEAKTGIGAVSVNGEDLGTKARHKDGAYELEAETGTGDVILFFKEDRW